MDPNTLFWMAVVVLITFVMGVYALFISLLSNHELRKDLVKARGEHQALEHRFNVQEDALSERITVGYRGPPASDQQELLNEVDARIKEATKEHMTMAVMDAKLRAARDGWLLLVDHKIDKVAKEKANGATATTAYSDVVIRRVAKLEAAISAYGRCVGQMNDMVLNLFRLTFGLIKNSDDFISKVERLDEKVSQAKQTCYNIEGRVINLEANIPPETPDEDELAAYVEKHYAGTSAKVKLQEFDRLCNEHTNGREAHLRQLEEAKRNLANAKAAESAADATLRSFRADPSNARNMRRLLALERYQQEKRQLDAALQQAENDLKGARKLSSEAPAASTEAASPQIPQAPATPSS